jgi:hypothetical protein
MDEDYDIYGGAPWSAYHDDVDDAYWQEHDREVATPGFSDLADADRRFFEQQERAAEQEAYEADLERQKDEDRRLEEAYWYEQQLREDETLNGLGDFDGGTDA